jgi:hypothetical protein
MKRQECQRFSSPIRSLVDLLEAIVLRETISEGVSRPKAVGSISVERKYIIASLLIETVERGVATIQY